MGCHDATCSLTRTAIIPGDKALIVCLWTKEWNTYQLNTDLRSYQAGSKSSPIRYFCVGEYLDEHSWAGEDVYITPEEGYWRDYCFLIHLPVVEDLLDKSFEFEDIQECDVIAIIQLANTARIELTKMSSNVGRQYTDIEEITLQRKIMTLSEMILDNHIKAFKDGFSSECIE
jgi:hypothetical protein